MGVVYILVVKGKDVKAFATLPFLENYCEKNGIEYYTVRKETKTKE